MATAETIAPSHRLTLIVLGGAILLLLVAGIAVETKITTLVVLSSLIVTIGFLSPAAFMTGNVLFKSLVDIFWFIQFDFFGAWMNLQRFLGFAVPLFGILAYLGLRRSGEIPRRTFGKLGKILAVWIVVNVFSLFNSPLPTLGFFEFTKVVGPLVFLLWGAQIIDSVEKFRKFVTLFLLSLVLPIMGAFAQPLGLLSFEEIGGTALNAMSGFGSEMIVNRVSGFYHDPATLLIFVMIGLPFVLERLYNAPSRREAFLYIVILVTFFTITYLTLLRAGWIAVFVELVVWFGLHRHYKAVLLIVMALGVYTVLNFKFLSLMYENAWKLKDPLTGELTYYGFTGRFGVWLVLMYHFVNSGIATQLLGSGLASEGPIQSALLQILPYIDRPYGPHNEYIRILIGSGIVGLAVYLLLTYRLYEALVSAKNNAKDKEDKDIAISLISLLSGVMVFTITGTPVLWTSFQWTFWFFLGYFFRRKTQ